MGKIKPSQEQLEIVRSNASKIVVEATAGSGKSACLMARVRRLLHDGVDPSQIVIITFTRRAAEELMMRLGNPPRLKIGTIHSYANALLISQGIDTSEILKGEDFDGLFQKIKEFPPCVEVEHLLLDEAQDTSPEQLEFIFNYVKPKNWIFFGDHRQNIYHFRGTDSSFFLDLIKDPEVEVLKLTDNYRSAQAIHRFAQNLIKPAGYYYVDNSRAVRTVEGYVQDSTIYNPYSIARTFKKMEQGQGKWFILLRYNRQLEELSKIFDRMGVPYLTMKNQNLSYEELKYKLSKDVVKIMTIHAAKGLQNDNVIVIGGRFHNLEERCLSYVAATRAKNKLYWIQPSATSQVKEWNC